MSDKHRQEIWLNSYLIIRPALIPVSNPGAYNVFKQGKGKVMLTVYIVDDSEVMRQRLSESVADIAGVEDDLGDRPDSTPFS